MQEELTRLGSDEGEDEDVIRFSIAPGRYELLTRLQAEALAGDKTARSSARFGSRWLSQARTRGRSAPG